MRRLWERNRGLYDRIPDGEFSMEESALKDKKTETCGARGDGSRIDGRRSRHNRQKASKEACHETCSCDSVSPARRVRNEVLRSENGHGPLEDCSLVEQDLQHHCCGGSVSRGRSHGLPEPSITPNSSLSDLEKGTTAIEHVALSVSGLGCMCCGQTLLKSLSAIPEIYNAQASLIMSQVEFDVDITSCSVEEAIQKAMKATGLTFQEISTRGQSLEVLVPHDAKCFANQKMPHGVETMVAIDKHVVRITYDAKLVGARDILENTFNDSEAGLKLAPAHSNAELEQDRKHVRKTAYMTALSIALTIPVLLMCWAPLPPHEVAYETASLMLATIVQVVVAGPFYLSALQALLVARVIEMDLLIVLSTSTAYTFSLITFAYKFRGHPISSETYFQTSTLLVTLIMVGRLVSAYAKHEAVKSTSIRSLQSQEAMLVDGVGSNIRRVDTRLLQYDDMFKVLPDARIVTDAIVVHGDSTVDESHVTGEATPVDKHIGCSIIAGSINGSGTLVARLTRLPGENTISEIAAMVDAAKLSKPKIQQLADRIASRFVPIIMALTLITFCIWIGIGIEIRDESVASAAVQAMTYAITVLIVSCPCAIGLAVPMVIVVAGGVGAKYGVVFRSGETIEIARKISHVVFDKTGTLTEGRLCVSMDQYLAGARPSAESLALALTMDSNHPVSAAVAAHLRGQSVQPAAVGAVKSITGRGMEGIWKGKFVRGGNARWLEVEHVPEVASMLNQGVTVFCICLDDELLAVYGLKDSLRPGARETVSELKRRNVAISLVSGDDDSAVQKVGHQLGISSRYVKSRCSPKDKQTFVKTLMENKTNVVLFCGDGTNDAVALAQAHVGLHINGGTDVAQSAADAVLVRPALCGILVLIDLSRAAFRRIAFNFAWSFIYNTFAILLAAGAFVHVRIPPQFAGLGELVSVLPVILIALQLRWFKRR